MNLALEHMTVSTCVLIMVVSIFNFLRTRVYKVVMFPVGKLYTPPIKRTLSVQFVDAHTQERLAWCSPTMRDRSGGSASTKRQSMWREKITSVPSFLTVSRGVGLTVYTGYDLGM